MNRFDSLDDRASAVVLPFRRPLGYAARAQGRHTRRFAAAGNVIVLAEARRRNLGRGASPAGSPPGSGDAA